MTALQNICIANEGVIHQSHRRQELENKEQAQNVEAVRTLNKELTAKTTALEEETHFHEEAKKVKTNMMI